MPPGTFVSTIGVLSRLPDGPFAVSVNSYTAAPVTNAAGDDAVRASTVPIAGTPDTTTCCAAPAATVTGVCGEPLTVYATVAPV
jgi:hypothetical protein